jgi:hypothetical protein
MRQAACRHRPSGSMVVAIVALVVALSGTAIASAGLVNGDKVIKENSLSGNRLRNHTVTGKQINLGKLGKVPSARLADSASNATHAQTADSASKANDSSSLGGAPANSYERFSSTLPSGQPESGDYGIRTPTTETAQLLGLSVSFPIPLATRLDASHVVFTTVSAPVTHCSGPGHADAASLCTYQSDGVGITDPPAIFEFEDTSFNSGTGNFGFTMDWPVTSNSPLAYGTWTVTAP